MLQTTNGFLPKKKRVQFKSGFLKLPSTKLFKINYMFKIYRLTCSRWYNIYENQENDKVYK